MRHTPTPWLLGGNLVVAEKTAAIICTMRLLNAEANAEFIVRAVNNFDSLLEACKIVLECAESGNPNGWRNKLQAAIKLAEEGK